jgi:hypothetical protein
MKSRILVRLLAVSCVCIGVGLAQVPTPAPAPTPKPASAPKPKFAIEIPSVNGLPPSYSTGGNGSSQLFFGGNLHWLPNADPGTLKPSAIKLEYKEDGELETITATAYYGKIDQNTPFFGDWYSLNKLESEDLGSYSGKLNDLVTVSGMERVGLQPLTVKIVTAQSDNPYHPQTRSDAPSLRINYSTENRVYGTVTIHNLSNKTVTAVHLGSLEDGDFWNQPEDNIGRKMSIAPGKSYRDTVFIQPHGRLVNGRYVERPLPKTMTLGAAQFADGSYEGDMQLAAGLAAYQFGMKVQKQRILSLAKSIQTETWLDDEARAERIRAEVKQLTEYPDAKTIASFRTQFSELPDSGVAWVRSEMGRGMRNEKYTFDSFLKPLEPYFNPNPPDTSLKHWLSVYSSR